MSKFFARLIERRVPQYMLVYVGAAWGILEFTQFIVGEYLLSPHWTRIVFYAVLMLWPGYLLVVYRHARPGTDPWGRIEKIGVPLNLALAFVALFLMFRGEDLGAQTTVVTLADESGELVEREVAKQEFRKVCEELALGIQLDTALHNLGNRVPLIDLKFFITGLILQRQTGANMVEVLENMAMLVRERLNLLEKMKASTAQQRFSAALLCSMPVVFAIGLWFLKPEYLILLYTDETGSKFLTYAICSEIIGILIIRKIASPKF